MSLNILLSFLVTIGIVQVVYASTPNGNYAPGYVACPPNFSLRPATGLSPNETAWRQTRQGNIVKSLATFLNQANLTGFNTTAYLQNITANASYVPVGGYAISGGGYLSLMTGLGTLQAMDDRYPPAVAAGTGGLFQCMTYLTGLSGGSLAVSTVAANNFPTIQQLIPQWNTTIPGFLGPNLTNPVPYFQQIFGELVPKLQAGFTITMTDLIGRMFSQYYISGYESGINKTYSDIQTYSNFSEGLAPMPILVVTEVLFENTTDTYYDGVYYPGINNYSTQYEYNPFEFGAWQGRANAFIPTEFLGTTMFNGSAANESVCVKGFDSITFAMGTSATAWNLWLVSALSNGTNTQFAKRSLPEEPQHHALEKRQATSLIPVWEQAFNETLNQSLYGVYPNPFQGYTPSATADQETLYLVDGSESGQTIPLWPLLQPARGLDLIIAWTASGETYPNNWQNGTDLIDTANAAATNGLKFPKVPSRAATFVDQGLNLLPTFFGCYEDDVPLVLYLANAPMTAYTNYSFYQQTFYPNQITEIMENSFNVVTIAGGASDPQWPACLACALIRGSLRKLGVNETEQCQACWSRHCWNGVESNATAAQVSNFDPHLQMIPGLSYDYWNQTYWGAFPPS